VAAALRKVHSYRRWLRRKKLENTFFDNLYRFRFICLLQFVPECTPYIRFTVCISAPVNLPSPPPPPAPVRWVFLSVLNPLLYQKKRKYEAKYRRLESDQTCLVFMVDSSGSPQSLLPLVRLFPEPVILSTYHEDDMWSLFLWSLTIFCLDYLRQGRAPYNSISALSLATGQHVLCMTDKSYSFYTWKSSKSVYFQLILDKKDTIFVQSSTRSTINRTILER
jgi:hypothetical protein